MQPTEPSFYASPDEYLQQGDIYRQEVVTPIVDTEKRLFRAADGRHGIAVFSEGATGNVFDEEELRTHLRNLTGSARTPLHTEPFELTGQGEPEFVVVQSKQASFFVIATQTCDVSAEDKPVRPTAIILPILTLLDICKNERLNFRTGGDATIENFLDTNAHATLKRELDPFAYSNKVRAVLSEWQP
jgi:hypothetical protein